MTFKLLVFIGFFIFKWLVPILSCCESVCNSSFLCRILANKTNLWFFPWTESQLCDCWIRFDGVGRGFCQLLLLWAEPVSSVVVQPSPDTYLQSQHRPFARRSKQLGKFVTMCSVFLILQDFILYCIWTSKILLGTNVEKIVVLNFGILVRWNS